METIIKGALVEVGELQTFDSGFKKRQIIVETEGEYPQKLPIDVIKQLAEDFHNVEGEMLEVHVNIRGNEYNGKHYVNLMGWKVNRKQD